MKRYLAALLALVLLLTGLTAVASAYEESGHYWTWDNGKYYLCDIKTGTRITSPAGWFKAYNTVIDEDYSKTWNWWVYIEADGSLAEGWKKIEGVWYYFWPEMVTGNWYDDEDQALYLFDENGAWTGLSATKTGWIQKGGSWYYVYEDDYFGLRFQVNEPYRFEDGTWYGFDKNGKMAAGGWYWEDDGEDYKYWYYANKDGTLVKGWKLIDGKWYYFNNGEYSFPIMARDGCRYINKVYYAFDGTGAMMANKWYHDHDTDYYTGEIYYYDDWLYLGADGAAKTGWFKVGNTWYYGGEYGWIWMDAWLEYNGATYFFDENGAMAVGWKQIGGDWFYFKASGAMAENEWIKDGNAWYYLGEEGAMYTGGPYNINGTDYTFDDNGVWIK